MYTLFCMYQYFFSESKIENGGSRKLVSLRAISAWVCAGQQHHHQRRAVFVLPMAEVIRQESSGSAVCTCILVRAAAGSVCGSASKCGYETRDGCWRKNIHTHVHTRYIHTRHVFFSGIPSYGSKRAQHDTWYVIYDITSRDLFVSRDFDFRIGRKEVQGSNGKQNRESEKFHQK